MGLNISVKTLCKILGWSSFFAFLVAFKTEATFFMFLSSAVMIASVMGVGALEYKELVSEEDSE